METAGVQRARAIVKLDQLTKNLVVLLKKFKVEREANLNLPEHRDTEPCDIKITAAEHAILDEMAPIEADIKLLENYLDEIAVPGDATHKTLQAGLADIEREETQLFIAKKRIQNSLREYDRLITLLM